MSDAQEIDPAASRRDALAKAQSAVAHLVSILAKGDDEPAYREAKVVERTLEWIAVRLGR